MKHIFFCFVFVYIYCMSEGGYKIRNAEGIYFLSFAVVGWVDVFSRQQYRDELLESLKFCQQKKGLRLHAWCIMSNHIHLIAAAQNNDLSDILRDFKKFTSTSLLTSIQNNVQESRKEWMLKVFSDAGKANPRNSTHQFWQQDNHPIECFSYEFTRQKLDYLHNNPVSAGIVDSPENYIYSSARDYYGKPGLLKVELLF